MTTNPILIEVTRGAVIESVHRGALAICCASRGPQLGIGDTGRCVYPRSAIKALQAIPLVECGAADAFGFGDEDLALACGSHSGSSEHVAGVARMLAKAGIDEGALACGAHWPLGQGAICGLQRAGSRPGSLHNNCSGKHAAMLAVARHRGLVLSGYHEVGHGVQRAIADVLETMTGEPHGQEAAAIDGCSAPTWPVPLHALARAFARFAGGAGLPSQLAGACARLMQACFAAPQMVAGPERFCTRVMDGLSGRAFVKAGAEGIYCASLPKAGIGVALKIDDGAKRAAIAVMACVLKVLLSGGRAPLDKAWDHRVMSWRGAETGVIEASSALNAALGELSITD